MELCHRKIWSEWFPESFSPHYSEVGYMTDDRIADIDLLNLVKSVLTGYIVILSLTLRASHYILLPVVAIIGSPIFLTMFCKQRAQQRGSKEAASSSQDKRRKGGAPYAAGHEDSSKKHLSGGSISNVNDQAGFNGVQLSSRRSQRLNQVGNEVSGEADNGGDLEGQQNRDSAVMPINQNGVSVANDADQFELAADNTGRIGGGGGADEMDIVEQLRSESIDLRINPVGMRRVIFKLKTDYGKVRR